MRSSLTPLSTQHLSQVMSPTSLTITTSRRPLNSSSRNPSATTGPWTRMTWTSMTTPSAERSLDHCSLRSEKKQPAIDKVISLLKKVCCPVSRRLSVMSEQGDLFLISLLHQSQTSEKIRETDQKVSKTGFFWNYKKEQILAECEAEIQKHEFQADYDRRSIQKLNETIESREEEICRAHQGDERLRRDQQLLHEHLLAQNRELREARE